MDNLWISFLKFFLTPDQICVIIDVWNFTRVGRIARVDFSEFRYCTIGAHAPKFGTEFWHCGAECASTLKNIQAGGILQKNW